VAFSCQYITLSGLVSVNYGGTPEQGVAGNPRRAPGSDGEYSSAVYVRDNVNLKKGVHCLKTTQTFLGLP
jgi:hypothetical protein